ncbi:hypothetical protein ZWY2020_020573 [Hordeum vulgare]|nr:hypothetical protein ZWY2020_020573 [Hordeum vulgare]
MQQPVYSPAGRRATGTRETGRRGNLAGLLSLGPQSSRCITLAVLPLLPLSSARRPSSLPVAAPARGMCCCLCSLSRAGAQSAGSRPTRPRARCRSCYPSRPLDPQLVCALYSALYAHSD